MYRHLTWLFTLLLVLLLSTETFYAQNGGEKGKKVVQAKAKKSSKTTKQSANELSSQSYLKRSRDGESINLTAQGENYIYNELLKARASENSDEMSKFLQDLVKKGILKSKGFKQNGYSAIKENEMKPRDFTKKDRELQVMKQIGNSLFHHAQQKADQKKTKNTEEVKEGGKVRKFKSPVEFELMHAGNVVFVACNNKENLERIKKLIDKHGLDIPLGKDLEEKYIKEVTKKWVQKLEMLDDENYVKERDKQAARTILEAFKSKPIIIDANEEELNKSLFTGKYGKLILVNGSDGFHAEIKFKQLIINASSQGIHPANKTYSVGGRKRPCTGCHIEFCELRATHKKLTVNFAADHGKIWAKPLFDAIQDIPESRLKKYIPKYFEVTYLTEGFGGEIAELSTSEVDEDDEEVEKPLRKKVKPVKKKQKTGR